MVEWKPIATGAVWVYARDLDTDDDHDHADGPKPAGVWRSDMTNCPRCRGTGETGSVLACGPTGSTLIDKAPCWVCKGNKTISSEQAERMDLGQRVRAERLRQSIHQAGLAGHLGIDRVAYSQAESLGIGEARTFDQMGAWLADQERCPHGHDTREGRLVGSLRDGWEPNPTSCSKSLEFRDGVTCSPFGTEAICHNHEVISGLRKHAVDADRFELENRRLRALLEVAAGRFGYLSTVLSLSNKNHNAKGALEWGDEIRAALAGR